MDTEKNLFKEFPPVSTSEWEQRIKKDLRGADYKEKLNWQTGEGISALPFYRRENLSDRSTPPVFTHKNDWEIAQPIFNSSPEKANKTAIRSLQRGADALRFKLRVRYTDGMLGGDLEGTAIQNQADFNTLLGDIDLTQVPVHFSANMASPVIAAMLSNFCDETHLDTSKIKGSFLYDPFTFILSNGVLPKKLETLWDEARQLTEWNRTHTPNMRILGIDTRLFHNSGATIVQELGFALAAGSDYLARLSETGLKPSRVAESIHFNFSIGSNYFLEIAKLRAARLLWKKILNAYNIDNGSTCLHGESSQWNKTIYDPYTNMLRTTTEGMSAAIAGCDSITLNPFDQSFDRPDEFSQRIARNSQIIMKEEAYLNKVSDPAAGSYYIETVTDKIAAEAWSLFQEVENQGGMLQSILDRYVSIAVEESRKKRDHQIARRGRILVGTNQYPKADEKKKARKAPYKTVSLTETENDISIDHSKLINSIADALNNGASLGDVVPSLFKLSRHNIRPLRPYRGAEPFEELRMATQQHAATPKVLTLPIGNKKMRKARSSFAVNFFGCVGHDIEDPIGFESMGEAITAIKEQQPDIIVLCSSDEEYTDLVPELCAKTRDLNSDPIIVLAGDPKDKIDEYRSIGIDEFIHSKCNVLETLKRFQQKLGIIKN